MDTGMAETLKDINIWPMAMTIIGTHGSRGSAAVGAAAGAVCVDMTFRLSEIRE
jgi:hypothetical protein